MSHIKLKPLDILFIDTVLPLVRIGVLRRIRNLGKVLLSTLTNGSACFISSHEESWRARVRLTTFLVFQKLKY